MTAWHLYFQLAIVDRNTLFRPLGTSTILQITGLYWDFVHCAMPDNFQIRSGRWRSQYVIKFDQGTVTGNISVHVHYYEQGNVNYPIRCSEEAFMNLQSGATHDNA